MAVPKKKISSSRRGKRRSHHALSDNMVMECLIVEQKKDHIMFALAVDTIIVNK